MFSLICAWMNGWINNRGAGNLRRHRARRHCNVIAPDAREVSLEDPGKTNQFQTTIKHNKLGWGLLSQYSTFRYFPHFPLLSKQTLTIEYHVYIWQVSPQPSCGNTCQIWMWFRESNRYFCKIENFAYGEIGERSFSNPHPWKVCIGFGMRINDGRKHRYIIWCIWTVSFPNDSHSQFPHTHWKKPSPSSDTSVYDVLPPFVFVGLYSIIPKRHTRSCQVDMWHNPSTHLDFYLRTCK